ncbi:SH2 domain protein, partial [Teladorsagia circumcincta]
STWTNHVLFWPDERQCGSSQCGIAFCDDEVPAGLRRPAVVTTVRLPGYEITVSDSNHTGDSSSQRRRNHTTRNIVSTSTLQDCSSAGHESNKFDPMDRSLDEGYREQLREMDIHDDQENKFCEVDDEDSSDMHYVDLSKNPERYTGYKGDSAIRVWKSIYQENCFKPDMKFDKNFLMHPDNFGLCLEKRVFYRLISGFHSAITISIAAYNYKPVREDDCVKHYRIRQLDQGGYFIARRRPFTTLEDLIAHYTNDADGLCVQLTNPCVKCEVPQTSTFTYDDQWEIDRRSVLFIKQIGAGQFGETSQAAHSVCGLYKRSADSDSDRVDAGKLARLSSRQRATVHFDTSCRNRCTGRGWNGVLGRDEVYSSGLGRS